VALSAEALVMVRPRATFLELAESPADAGMRTLLRRPLLLLIVLGGFVSLTSAGRLVAFHVAMTLGFWAFGPLAQGLAAALVGRALAPRLRPSQAVDLMMAGNGPWMLLLLGIAGVCLFTPDVFAAFSWLARSRVLPALVIGVVAWSAFLSLACVRWGFGASWPRAVAGTIAYYALYAGLLVAWLLATHQLRPLFQEVA
jgi:hypothetical protein